jgi:hypothetical protein
MSSAGEPAAARPVVLLAALFGALAAAFQIENTSIGWHLAAGRWMIAHHAVPRADPFSFSAHGRAWIDHEWLFQLVAAAIERLAGPAGLVGLRALLVAALAVLMARAGLRAGLAPAPALLLAVVCVWAARVRFFIRPELVTLALAPLLMRWFADRRDIATARLALLCAAALWVGANAHAGALIVPVLLAIAWAGELIDGWRARAVRQVEGRKALLVLALGAFVPLLNPYGWKLLEVPFQITSLATRDYIPNPEWISPSFEQAPALYLALVAAAALLILRGRAAGPWLLLLSLALLAWRHVRNVGLFFVLLPAVLAPALAGLPGLAGPAQAGVARLIRRALQAAAGGLILFLALSFVLDDRRALGGGWNREFHPAAACDFMDRERLPRGRLYNDVNFGGYLLGRYHPPRQVLLDDRNEIHAPLLQEMFAILRRSDTRSWDSLLERYRIKTALLRYVPRLTEVRTADGRISTPRSFSALWFPSPAWALVYWDDVAMVLVQRRAVDPVWLARREYRVVRPDDLEFLRRGLASGALDRRAFRAELERKLAEQPTCVRARYLLTLAPAG